jgi:hypothetical protein
MQPVTHARQHEVGTFLKAEPLSARIRGEYLEMPGLHLTLAQACRLWQQDPASCQSVLDQLVAEGFLRRTREGAYIA